MSHGAQPVPRTVGRDLSQLFDRVVALERLRSGLRMLRLAAGNIDSETTSIQGWSNRNTRKKLFDMDTAVIKLDQIGVVRSGTEIIVPEGAYLMLVMVSFDMPGSQPVSEKVLGINVIGEIGVNVSDAIFGATEVPHAMPVGGGGGLQFVQKWEFLQFSASTNTLSFESLEDEDANPAKRSSANGLEVLLLRM